MTCLNKSLYVLIESEIGTIIKLSLMSQKGERDMDAYLVDTIFTILYVWNELKMNAKNQ